MEKKKKCFCRKELTFCGECESKMYPLDDQELDDILSALSYFVSDYKDAPKTKKRDDKNYKEALEIQKDVSSRAHR